MDNKELGKEELEQVSGGCYLKEVDDKYYHYAGDKSKLNLKYVCPKCGKPVYHGFWGRYYCDDCKESWFFEESLMPNLKSGVWKQISEEEYFRIFAEGE